MRGYDELFPFFEENLAKHQFENEPHELYAPIDYTLELGGKRIRPVLTLMSCEMFGSNALKALPQAIAIELFHNFTLIHDDIMDNAPVRRGEPTVHVKWNDNVGILSGDGMLVMAYKLLETVGSAMLPAIFKDFNRTSLEVCEGQQYDMDFESRSLEQNPVSESEYMEMTS